MKMMGLGICSADSRWWRCGSGWTWGWFEDGGGALCGVSMALEELHFYSTGKVFDVGPEWEYWTMWWKWGENGDDGCLRRVFGCEIGHGGFTFENVRTCRSFLLKIIFGNLKEKQFLKTKHTKFVCTAKKITAKAPAIVNKPTSPPHDAQKPPKNKKGRKSNQPDRALPSKFPTTKHHDTRSPWTSNAILDTSLPKKQRIPMPNLT
jgi:hypothetical protein